MSRGALRIGLLALAFAASSGCKKKEEPMSVPLDQPSATPEAPKAAESISATSLTRAIELSRGKMQDGPDLSDGAKLLIAWSQQGMAWEDVDLKSPETTLIRADSDTRGERGKRLCESGTISELKDADLPGGWVKVGILARNGQELLQMIAVRNPGTLAVKSAVRFCGVVTARVDRPGADGGAGHVIQVVGMFDIADNHRPTALQAQVEATRGPAVGPGGKSVGSASSSARPAPSGPTGRTISSSL
jgi:hypothetical protein